MRAPRTATALALAALTVALVAAVPALADSLVGSPGPDVLNGLPGPDQLYGEEATT